MTDVNADLLAALKWTHGSLHPLLDNGGPSCTHCWVRDAIEAAERGESADAKREQARAEHLGELAAEREMVQAQTPVVNVEGGGWGMRCFDCTETMPTTPLPYRVPLTLVGCADQAAGKLVAAPPPLCRSCYVKRQGGDGVLDAHGDLSGLGDDDCRQYTEEENA